MMRKLSALNRKKITKITDILESIFKPMEVHGQCLVSIDQKSDKIRSYTIQMDFHGNPIPFISAYTFDEICLKVSLLQKGLIDFNYSSPLTIVDSLIEHLNQTAKKLPDLVLLLQEIERNIQSFDDHLDQKLSMQQTTSVLKH